MAFNFAGQYGPEVLLATAPSGFQVTLPSLSVNVYQVGTTTAVTLYTSRTKGTTRANPVPTDVKGNLTFFADPGQYDIVFTPPGGSQQRITVEVGLDPSEVSAAYVAQVNASTLPGADGTNNWVPMFTQSQPSSTALNGFKSGTARFNGNPDPITGWGTFDTDGSQVNVTWQNEASWDCRPATAVTISETYWQIVDPSRSVTSLRPFYAQYDRTNHKMGSMWLVVGSGTRDTGSPLYFNVQFDDQTNPVGTTMIQAWPNRLGLFAVTTGGVSADMTRFNMYSTTAKGAGLALSYGGSDPESFVTAWLLQTVGAGQAVMYSNGHEVMEFSNDSVNGAIGFLGAGAIVRPSAYTLNAGATSRNLASGATVANVEQVLRQVITDLKSYGLLA